MLGQGKKSLHVKIKDSIPDIFLLTIGWAF